MAEYTNIDGVSETTTRWYIPGLMHQTNAGASWENIVAQTYAYIQMEIPSLTDINDDAYWLSEPRMKTKLSVSNNFSLAFTPVSGSITVYLDGVEVDATPDPLFPKRFTISTDNTDGYLWVSYLVDSVAYQGSSADVFDQPRVVPAAGIPEVSHLNIGRARRTVNHIESYLDMVPSAWVGGPENRDVSLPLNIIGEITTIVDTHITELQQAITRVEDKLDGLTEDIVYPRTTFTTIAPDSLVMVQYIEEILTAINQIETKIIGGV